ncbi:hypothetical protein [Leptospira interrogans]|uniref:hypothetical protein n=1 Tax=Leptospira interrogans TaxID=173 RepID=UPI0011DFDBB1|nr:hypothetical protein [Leptospira interrogans]QEI00787.1 hypothetical protein FWJ33_16125 [Leptospira interrogans serovar Hardjo]
MSSLFFLLKHHSSSLYFILYPEKTFNEVNSNFYLELIPSSPPILRKMLLLGLSTGIRLYFLGNKIFILIVLT